MPRVQSGAKPCLFCRVELKVCDESHAGRVESLRPKPISGEQVQKGAAHFKAKGLKWTDGTWYK